MGRKSLNGHLLRPNRLAGRQPPPRRSPTMAGPGWHSTPWRRLLERPSAREVAFSGTPFPVVAGKREIAGHSHRRAPSVPIQWQKTAGPRSTSKIDRNSFPPNKPGRGQTRFPPASKSRRSKSCRDWRLLSQRDRRRLRAATNATPAIPSRVAVAGSGIPTALISQ